MELFSSSASAVNRCSLLLGFLLLILSTSLGQTIPRRVPGEIRNTSAAKVFADSTPIQRAASNRKLNFNPKLATTVNNASLPVNQGEDLNQYIQGRNDCAVERSIDTNNCVLVKYQDGLIKRICDGELKEVITPDGKKHRARQIPDLPTIAAPRLPVVPQANLGEPTYKWLTDLNGELLRDIEQLFDKNRRTIAQYLKRENENCTNDVFKQVIYRITFIENFLVAK